MTTDRIADLERLVYGSGASDDEREAATRELLELRASAVHESASADADADATAPSGIDATGADGLAVDMPPAAATAADPRRRVRRVIIAATAALVIGVLAGWQLGAREAEQQAELAAAAESVFPGPRTQAEYLAALPVAADSPAIEVFQRPATAADTPTTGTDMDFGNGPLEYRLLATRADGLPVYAARDDSELCLFVTFGVSGGSGTCTSDGRFPAEGLRLNGSVYDASSPSVDVTWRADGSLSINMLAG